MPSPPGPLSQCWEKGRIGIFDSGVGGLTVVGELLKRFPDERILYVADQAHVPYGGRPLEDIRQFACGISSYLAREGCRAVVMACNISSAVALDSVRESLAPLPVFGMIEAAASKAAKSRGRIGVLATQGTVTSGAYTREIYRFDPDAVVKEVACPKFVPLVESGETSSDDARQAAREYLSELRAARSELIILGCTHYPYLLPVLREVSAELWGNSVSFIDPAVELIDSIGDKIGSGQSAGSANQFLTTGDLNAFRTQMPLFLPHTSGETVAARWDGNTLGT